MRRFLAGLRSRDSSRQNTKETTKQSQSPAYFERRPSGDPLSTRDASLHTHSTDWTLSVEGVATSFLSHPLPLAFFASCGAVAGFCAGLLVSAVAARLLLVVVSAGRALPPPPGRLANIGLGLYPPRAAVGCSADGAALLSRPAAAP